METPFTIVSSPAVDMAAHGYRLTARGELDMKSSPQLLAHMEELAEAGAVLVVLDLTKVSFLDSAGLRAIIQSGNLLAAHDGRLLIEGMSGAVQQVLEITGMIDHYRAPS